MGTEQVWGPIRTKPFLIETQPFKICKSTQIQSLHPPKRDHHSQTEEKKVCQHLHSRNRVGGGAFCSSGAGRFYCFVQCLCTRNSPHRQTHRFRVPTVLLRVQYLPRDTLSPHKKKSRQENILKDKIKLSQSGTLLIPSQAAFWMRSSFIDGLTSVPDKSPVA